MHREASIPLIHGSETMFYNRTKDAELCFRSNELRRKVEASEDQLRRRIEALENRLCRRIEASEDQLCRRIEASSQISFRTCDIILL